MNIVMVTETLMPGGAELFAVRLANALSNDHSVTIAVLHGERIHDGVARQVDPAVHVEQLVLPAKRGLWKVDGLLRRLRIDRSVIGQLQQRWLRRLVKRTRAQIVHSHLVPSDLLVARVKKNIPFAQVVTVHGDYLAYLGGATKALFLDRQRKIAGVLDSADAVVTIAADQERRLLALFPGIAGKVFRISNGYSPASGPAPDRCALGLPKEGLLIGMVSRGVEGKGWASAIAAFEKAKIAGATLVLVGSGPYLDRLEKERLPPNVLLIGFAARPTNYIHHFDICVLPSEFPHESLPTAVIEYLYCGKPVIATDVGEIAAMIEAANGERAGTLVKLEGTADIKSLAAAMKALADDPDARARLGNIARQAFSKFEMLSCVEKYDALYRSFTR